MLLAVSRMTLLVSTKNKAVLTFNHLLTLLLVLILLGVDNIGTS